MIWRILLAKSKNQLLFTTTTMRTQVLYDNLLEKHTDPDEIESPPARAVGVDRGWSARHDAVVRVVFQRAPRSAMGTRVR